MTTTRTSPLQATRAVYAVFTVAGVLMASWISRIPEVRDALNVTPAGLGIVLLALSVGSVTALFFAGLTVTRLGTARTVAVSATVAGVGLVTIAFGVLSGPVLVGVGLATMGVGFGTWDVAMNVEGAEVERHLGRTIMPRFHAAFSIGTVGGAAVGAGLSALGVSVTAHLVAVAVLSVATVVLSSRWFLPVAVAEPDAPQGPSVLKAWTEPRTLLIGVFVLAMAFSEGTGNDWLGVATVDGYGVSNQVGALSFALFVAAMTVGRIAGTPLIDKWGRVPVLRTLAALAFVGLMLYVFGPNLPLALVGVAAWGLGTSLGFPVGMSAAADDAARSASRVGVVASIGYTAFLAGPPLIGFLGDHIGVLKALSVAAGLLAIGLLLAGSTRPLEVPADPED